MEVNKVNFAKANYSNKTPSRVGNEQKQVSNNKEVMSKQAAQSLRAVSFAANNNLSQKLQMILDNYGDNDKAIDFLEANKEKFEMKDTKVIKPLLKSYNPKMVKIAASTLGEICFGQFKRTQYSEQYQAQLIEIVSSLSEIKANHIEQGTLSLELEKAINDSIDSLEPDPVEDQLKAYKGIQAEYGDET